MAANRQYDHEFKVQAIKLAQEIGQAKAAKELGISKNTMYTWTRAQRLGYVHLRQAEQDPFPFSRRWCQVPNYQR